MALAPKETKTKPKAAETQTKPKETKAATTAASPKATVTKPSGSGQPKPFLLKDGQFVLNPARKTSGQGGAKPSVVTPTPAQFTRMAGLKNATLVSNTVKGMSPTSNRPTPATAKPKAATGATGLVSNNIKPASGKGSPLAMGTAGALPMP